MQVLFQNPKIGTSESNRSQRKILAFFLKHFRFNRSESAKRDQTIDANRRKLGYGR